MDGLLIKTPWIDKILSGDKTWELRGSKTTKRGEIALIRSGSGSIIGKCEIIDVIGPLTLDEMKLNLDKAALKMDDLKSWPFYKNTYAWVIRNAEKLEKPIAYKHPSGAVIWVKLN